MPKPKGGRGHRAPYEAKLIRVPTPLADQVEQLKDRYQDFLDQGGEPLQPPPLLDAIADDKPVNRYVNRYEHPEQAPIWHIGDLCACIQPSGVVIPQVRIMSFWAKNQTCKVYEESTESHWSARFDELIPLPVYKVLENTFKQNQELKEERDKLVNELYELRQKLTESQQERDRLEQENVKLIDSLAESERLWIAFNTEAKPVNEFDNQAIASADEPVNTEAKPINEFDNQAIASADEPVNTEAKPVNEIEEDADEFMTQSQLARFLGVSHTTVAKHKLLPDFGDWSSQRDPDGVAWAYDQKTKLFYPQD